MRLSFRRKVEVSDRETVRGLTESTGFFNPEEVLVSVELVDAFLEKGAESGYLFLFCEDEGRRVMGYTCYGRVPGTRESFDLYWIAVDRGFQGRGIGRRLMERSEKDIARLGGSRIYLETSSRDLYTRTRAFYIRSGYVQEALLRDFYAPGDSKVIYVKELFHSPF